MPHLVLAELQREHRAGTGSRPLPFRHPRAVRLASDAALARVLRDLLPPEHFGTLHESFTAAISARTDLSPAG